VEGKGTLFQRLRPKLTFANAISVLALFVALGGVGYAATVLPKNSVGTKQLKNGSVTQKKISVAAQNALRGATGPQGERGSKGDAGASTAPGATIPAGTTLRGSVAPSVLTVTPGGASAGQGVSFGGFQMPSRPVAHVIPPGGPASAQCPGSSTSPEATSGNLCVYVTSTVPSGEGQVVLTDPGATELSGLNYNLEEETETIFADGTVSRFGFQLSYSGPTTNSAQFRGTWAVTG
jgi:hypothetical protein